MAQYDVNLRDYFRMLRRRKGIIILVPLLFGFFSFAVAFLQVPKALYRATSVVRIERTISPTGLLQEVIAFSPVGGVETQAALIKGFPVLSRAAKKLGLVDRETTPEQVRGTPSHLKTLDILQAQVEVKTVDGASLIEISATSPEPEQAARIANSLAEAFQEDNFATRSRQVREAREFIERQLQEVGSRLRQSEDALKAFKERNRIFVLPDEVRGTLSQLAAAEGESDGIRRAIDDTRAQLLSLEQGPARGRPSPIADGDPVLSKLQVSLSEFTLERENLLLTLLPAHPAVVDLDARIDSVRQRLRDALTGKLQALRGRADDVAKNIARLRREQAAIPETSLEIARMEREVKISERLFSLLKERHQEALIKEKEQVAEVSLVRPAMVPVRSINPPQALPKAAIGLVIGLVMGCVLAFVVETLDTSIGAIDEVESLLTTPVLGVIPHLDAARQLSEESGQAVALDKEAEEKYTLLLGLFFPKSTVVEAIRALRTNLLFSAPGRDLKTIMVTSSGPGEGKTTLAINLAIGFAQLGKRTLLIEADLRHPYLHHAFGIPKEPGFTDIMIGSSGLDEAIRNFPDLVLGTAGLEGLIDRPGVEYLAILPSGLVPPNPAEFLSTPGVATLLAELRQRYDYVILDCAPVLPVADSTILGSLVDGTLLAVRVGSVSGAALRRAKALLDSARARVIGACLTGVKAELSPDYYEMAYYPPRAGSQSRRTRNRRSGRSSGWVGATGGAVAGHVKGVALALLLSLALAMGIWAWRSGRAMAPFQSALPVRAGSRAYALEPVRPAPATQFGGLSRAVLPKRTEPTQPGLPAQRASVAYAAEPVRPVRPLQVAGLNRAAPKRVELSTSFRPLASRAPRYTVQLHAFRVPNNAQAAVARYRVQGLPVFSAQVVVGYTGRWWRILVGEFEKREAAEAFAKELVSAEKVGEFRVITRAATR